MDRVSLPVNAGRAAPAGRRPCAAGALVLALATLLAVPACGLFQAPVIARGNRPTEAQIKDISVGVHTRDDIQAMLGSPTSSSAFGDQNWYYISARTRLRPMRHFGISDPETVLGEADMQDVRMVSRETPSPGNERTLTQALFGNIGRVGTGALGAEQGPGAGSSAR